MSLMSPTVTIPRSYSTTATLQPRGSTYESRVAIRPVTLLDRALAPARHYPLGRDHGGRRGDHAHTLIAAKCRFDQTPTRAAQKSECLLKIVSRLQWVASILPADHHELSKRDAAPSDRFAGDCNLRQQQRLPRSLPLTRSTSNSTFAAVRSAELLTLLLIAGDRGHQS